MRRYQRDCHLKIDEQFCQKFCPGKVGGRDARELYSAKLEKEHELYIEIDVPDWCYKRP